MLINDLFRLSFHNLFLHKVRSFLTSLGIIFGVSSVIAMLAISEGAKNQALSKIESFGINNIILASVPPSPQSLVELAQGGSRGSVNHFGLTNMDLVNIKKMENIDHISTIRDTRMDVFKGLKSLNFKLVGCNDTFLKDTNSKLILGRCIAPVDMLNRTQCCVIGKNVKRKFFLLSKDSVIGKRLVIQKKAYQIVGVIENSVGTLVSTLGSPNDMILIPNETAFMLYGTLFVNNDGFFILEHDVFIIKVKDIDFMDDTAKRITAYMNKIHTRNSDWSIFIPLDLLTQKMQTQNMFTIIMGSIAGISLIVGGIGIMNIMLANVYERRKEIGTRRALGAKKRDVLYQFLIETIFLTVTGGGIGIVLGMSMSWLISYYANWATTFSFWSILLSFIISAIVGVLFGTYPAWKAAQQNPIDVLRAE